MIEEETMEINKFDELMNQLEVAYKENNVTEMNRLNTLIMEGLEVSVSESSLDFEFIESIRGKNVYKGLCKVIDEKQKVDAVDTLKLISSLVTHLVIESEVKKKDIKNYPIKLFTDMISGIVTEGKIEDAQRFLRDKYGRFI